MGGAISSNLASAVAEISNSIQASASGATNQSNSCIQQYKFKNCSVGGDFNATNACNVYEMSKSIIEQIQTNNISNNIAQQLSQTADSTVGSLGIGFAEATNAANAYAGATTDISNTVSQVTTQNSRDITTFSCEGSDFLGNFTFNVNSDANFLSDQMLQNISNNTVVNQINQTITQKATATVQGLAGLIIAIAILIVAIGWVLFRPLQLAMGSRIFVLIIIILILLCLILTMYLLELPPFFSKPATCINIQGATIGACQTGIECTDTIKNTIHVDKPPLKYAFPIIGQGDTSLGQNPADFQAGLLQMIIAKAGGWNENTYQTFQNDSNYQPKGGSFPSPLAESSGSYITNVKDWDPYLNNNDNANKARFFFVQNLQLENYTRIYDSEQCEIAGAVYQDDAHCYRFTPDEPPARAQDGIIHGGNIAGAFGYCNTNLYKSQKYIRWIGIIVLVVIILLMVYLFVFRKSLSITPKSVVITK